MEPKNYGEMLKKNRELGLNKFEDFESTLYNATYDLFRQIERGDKIPHFKIGVTKYRGFNLSNPVWNKHFSHVRSWAYHFGIELFLEAEHPGSRTYILYAEIL